MPLTKAQAISAITKELDALNVPYKTDDYVIQPDTEAILVAVTIPSMSLAIDVNEIADVSPDTYPAHTKERTQQRAIIARAAGYGLVQMLTTDIETGRLWPYLKDRIKAHAQGRQICGARECEIKRIDTRTRNKFLSRWHAHGPISRAGTTVALIKDEEIMSCMALGKPRYSEDGLEMLRYCTRSDQAVSGGFERLLSHARKIVGRDTLITTYADLNTSLRPVTVYDKLFEPCGITPPDYKWTNPATGDVRSRYQCMKHKLIAEGADPSMTERQIMLSREYVRVYGPGSLKYELRP